jgi:hypothetical protein
MLVYYQQQQALLLAANMSTASRGDIAISL